MEGSEPIFEIANKIMASHSKDKSITPHPKLFISQKQEKGEKILRRKEINMTGILVGGSENFFKKKRWTE